MKADNHSKTTKIIFIHGGGGWCDHTRHWFPYAEKRFLDKGLVTCNKDFPEPERTQESKWIPFLKNECKPDENSVIIGHSYGATCALRYAEKNQILGLVLVAGFYTELDEDVRTSGFTSRPWNWTAIKENTQWIIQFHSEDDPYISMKEARELSKFIKSELHEYKNAMHFGIDGINPYFHFPELVEEVLKKLSLR